jgi:DNA-binding Xre family transcriptional regulator
MMQEESESTQEIEPVAVIITLKEHLARLEAEETKRAPAHRRHVPTVPELAEAVNISRQGMYNFATGDVKLVNRELLAAIINELQARGFPTEVGDLLKAYPASAVNERA